MKLSASLVGVFSFTSAVLFSPVLGVSLCAAENRVLVDARTVTAAGHKFQIATKACSADVLASRPLEKRLTFNSCNVTELLPFTCVTNQGPGPLLADCAALQTAIVAAFEGPGQPPLFTVAPQFVQEFSLGTCLWAWINNNPVNGATLQYCYSALTNTLGPGIDNSCIAAGDTGGFIVPSNPALDPRSLAWAFEVLHS
ncbi:hypothetical protein DFH06DRAFT_1332567 [Mycena polygramma]|nr:hypothetical protein DFH06DRAFT_1332567 [Mycena polygramma]